MKKIRGLLMVSFGWLMIVPVVVNSSWLGQNEARIKKLTKLTSGTNEAKNSPSDRSNQSEQEDLIISESGELVGLTSRGKTQPVLIIPRLVKKITLNSLSECSSNLVRIIFEERYEADLQIDPDAFRDLVQRVSFFVSEVNQELALKDTLVKYGVEKARIFPYWTDEQQYFYLTSSQPDIKANVLIGLTLKAQKSDTSILSIPGEVVEFADYAFSNCPKTVDEIDLVTKEKIKLITPQSLSGLEKVKRFRVHQNCNGVGLVLSGVDLATTKIIISDAGEQKEVEVSDSFILGASQNQEKSLLGLTKQGQLAQELVVSLDIKQIEEEGLADTGANSIEFLHKEHLVIKGSLPKTNYFVNSRQMANNLVKHGISEVNIKVKDETFKVYVEGDYLLRDHANGEVELYALTPSGQEKDYLVITSKINLIGSNAWVDASFSQLEFAGENEVKIHADTNSNWKVLTKNIKTAFNLLNRNLKQVDWEKDGERFNLVSEDGNVYQFGHQSATKWVGVLADHQSKEKLVISPQVNIVGANAFEGINTKSIRFEHEGEIEFEGEKVPDVEYEVKHEATANSLRNRGVTKSITIIKKNQYFIEWIDEGCIIRNEGPNCSLIGLTGEMMEKEFIQISEKVNFVYEKALVDARAKKIKFPQENLVRFEEGVPNVVYEVSSLANGLELIKAKVTNQISVNTTNESFVIQAKDDCILKTDESGVSLLGLTPQGKQKRNLIIPEEVKVVLKDAFAYTKAEKITFQSLSPVKFNGDVPNVAYVVNNRETAQNLRAYELSYQVTVNEGEQTFIEQLKGNYWLSTNQAGLTRLVGLTYEANQEKILTVPSEVNLINKDVFQNVVAKKIVLLNPKVVAFEGKMPDVDYEVKQTKTAINLFNVGVNRAIFVSENNQDFVLHNQDGFIFKTDQSPHVTLVYLKEAGQRMEELVVPANINAVAKNALNHSRATKISFDCDGEVKVDGLIPNKHYVVKHEKTIDNLIEAGVKTPITFSKDEQIFTEENRKGLIIRHLNQRSVLKRLTLEAQERALLVVPEDVSLITQGALNQSKAVQITLENAALEIEGSVPNTNYKVKQTNVGDQLINAGVTKMISVNENGHQFELQVKNGCVIKKTDGVSSLIRLKKERQESNAELIIPAEVSVLGLDSLSGTKAQLIHLLYEGVVEVQGSVVNANYFVCRFESAINLFKAGVTRDIVVGKNDKRVIALVEDGFILKQKNNEITLVDLLDEKKNLTRLVIPLKVNVIGTRALDRIAALEVSLMNKQPVSIHGIMPDLRYEVANSESAVNLIKSQVKQKINVSDGQKTFWLQADENFILRSDLHQKEIALFGLINPSLVNEKSIKIPASVNVFSQKALGNLKVERLNFLHDGEVNIVGSVSDIYYETKDLKTAINLVNAGVNKLIDVYEENETYSVKAFGQIIVKINQKNEWLLIGLTQSGKQVINLVIPPEVLVIKKDSLAEAKAAKIVIENENEVKVEEGVLDVEYKVKNVKTALNLIDQHVSKNIEVNNGVNIDRLWVKDGYVLSAGLDNIVKLISLTLAKISADELILPVEVDVIEKDALEKANATLLRIKRDGVVQVNGLVGDRTYEVNRLDTAFNLINAGATRIKVSEAKEDLHLEVVDGFILRLIENHQKSLFGLTRWMADLKNLTLPQNISSIEKDALKHSKAVRISINHPNNLLIHGQVPDVIYEVRSRQIADALVEAGAGVTKDILIYEGNEMYVQYVKDGCVLRNNGIEVELVKLTNLRRHSPSYLEIPLEVTKINEHSLMGIKAGLVKFLNEDPIKINGLVPDVRYEVKQLKTAQALINAGAKKAIKLNEGGQVYSVELIDGCVVKKNQSGVGELIDLMPDHCKRNYLVIPVDVGIIGDGILLKSTAEHIKLNYQGEVKFIGDVPNVKYELTSARSATCLLVEKKVKIPVLVYENDRYFTQRISNHFIIQEEDQKVILAGFTKQFESHDELVIPKEIKFVAQDVLSKLTIKQIEFLAEDEVNFDGVVCDTDYQVKNLKTAINLVNQGVRTCSVYVSENDQIFVIKLDGDCIIRTNQMGVSSLLGFNYQCTADHINIPAIVSVIEPDALKSPFINFIRILYPGEVSFRGKVPDVEYEVMNMQVARDLIDLGVSNRIRINLSSGMLTVQVIDNCLVGFKGMLVDLIDVLDHQVKVLVIANIITNISSDVLKNCRQLTKVIFAKDSQLKEVSADSLSNLDKKITFFAYEREVINSLRAASVDADRIGIAYGDFFVCSCNQNRLIGLTASGQQNKETIIIPKHTSYISADAFEGCQSQTIDFTQIEDSTKLTINGQPFAKLKVNYRVSDAAMIQKLTQAGGVSDRIEMVAKKAPKSVKSHHVIAITIASVCVGILTIGLAIGLSRRSQHRKE